MSNTTILLLMCLNLLPILVVTSEICLSDLEDQCGAICYPTVRPLLRYMGECHHKEKQLTKLKDRSRDLDVEIIKWKSAADTLTEFNEQLTEIKGSCGKNSTLKQAIDDVSNMKFEFGNELQKLQSIVKEHRMK